MDKRLSHSLGRDSGTDSMKFFFNSLMLAWCFFISSWVLSRSYHQKDRVSEGTQRGLGLPKLCLAKLHSAELLPTSQTVLTLQTHKGSVRSPPLGLIGINCNHGTGSPPGAGHAIGSSQAMPNQMTAELESHGFSPNGIL